MDECHFLNKNERAVRLYNQKKMIVILDNEINFHKLIACFFSYDYTNLFFNVAFLYRIL